MTRFGRGPGRSQAIWRSSARRHAPLTARRPAADVQRLPIRSTTQIVSQGWIVYAFGRHDAADAQSGKCKCALASLRFVQIVEKDLDQFFQYLSIRSFHCVAATHDIRWQRDQRAAGLAVVEVVSGEVCVNDALAAWLARHRSMGWFGLPRLGCLGAKEPANSLGIELLLIRKMAIPRVRPAFSMTSSIETSENPFLLNKRLALSTIFSRVSRLCSGE